jgi:CheY-like chemotaxis protein
VTVLIVEDDENKSRQLSEFIRKSLTDAVVTERRSYRSGLYHIVHSELSLILLDMSMPTFDVSSQERGGRTRAYGGRDILDEMRRRKITTRVIVVTQFETFGEGADRTTLAELDSELKASFPGNYLGSVYYHPAQSNWQDDLRRIMGDNEAQLKW